MKAVTVKALWAHLAVCGDISVLYLPFSTDYRGNLLICSSNAVDEPNTILGHALCIVTLEDVVPFKAAHLPLTGFEQKPKKRGFAWCISDVRYLEPFPVADHPTLFEVDDLQIKPCHALLSEGALAEFFKRAYLPKFNGEPLPTYEAWLAPVRPDAQWQDNAALNTLVEGVMPLKNPPGNFKDEANRVLHREITNGQGVWCYRGSPVELRAVLDMFGMLTPKMRDFLRYYPDSALAFRNNYYRKGY